MQNGRFPVCGRTSQETQASGLSAGYWFFGEALWVWAMALKKMFFALFGVQLALVIALGVCSILLHQDQNDLNKSQDIYLSSYLLADELRQSSDDLTRLARTYVATGDEKFEQQYWTVLDIRGGKSPRPEQYNRIYWDLIAATGLKPRPDGRNVPLYELMVNEGFTNAEFQKLKVAEENSDELVKTEKIAMNAVKGLFADSSGKFTVMGKPDREMAIRIMNDETYHKAKADIMRPINEFYGMFMDRTARTVITHQRRSSQLLWSILALTCAVLGMFWYSFATIKRQIIKRERAEEERRISERRFRGALENVQLIAVELDSEGKVLFCNDFLLDLVKLRRDEVVGHDWFDLFLPESERESVRAVYRDFLRGSTHFLHYENHLLLSSGELRLIRWKNTLVREGRECDATTISLGEDITERRELEFKLAEQTEKFRGIFEESVAAIYVFDGAKRFIDSNQAGLDLLGYSREELLTMSIRDVDADPVVVQPAHGQLLAGDRIVNFEHRLVRKDGRVITVLNNSRPLSNPQGAVIGMQSTLVNITERKRAEEALRESEYFFRESQHAASTGSYKVDFNTGIWESSDVLDEIFGIDQAYNRNIQTWLNLVHPDDREMMDNYLREEVISKHIPFNKEYRVMRRSDGAIRWVNGRGSIKLDTDGNAASMYGTIQDITDRKRTEHALRESEERYKLITDHSPVAIGLHRDGKFLHVNPAAVHLFHATRAEDIIGHSVLDLVHSDYRDEVIERIRKAQVDGLPAGFREEKLVCLDGAVIDAEVQGVAVEFQGQKTMLVFVNDITDRKQAEQERLKFERQIQQTQKLESLGVLSGGIAHDFNNILMAVLGNAELALEDLSPTSPARESITQIATAAHRAADLCRQMMAYSGKASFVKEPVNLCSLIQEMTHLLKTSISKKVIMNLHLASDLPAVHGDPSQLRQIVMNLIINASDAIGDQNGVITVSASTVHCDEDYLRSTELHDSLTAGDYVCLEVTDTGAGMDADTQARIFEPFFTTKFTGRGLGLSAVLGIVKTHKGALKLVSELGKGTTFSVFFPASHHVAGSDPSATLSVSADTSKKGTVLIVDDEPMLLTLGRKMLERMGFAVLTAADGHEALELYRKRKHEIDLVILDMTMPNMGGHEAFVELTLVDPDVRVIIASGHTAKDVSACFKGRNPAGYLQKPFTIGKLRELIEGVIVTPESFTISAGT